MKIIIKTEEEIKKIREGGKILAKILQKVAKHVKPGISTFELDVYASKYIKEAGGKSPFLNYKPDGASYPFPASICISVNEELVHGLPKKDKILKNGDIVSLDLGLEYDGLFTDHAITVPVGKISDKDKKLIEVTRGALEAGIWAACGGATVGDIGYAIQSFVNRRFNIIKELAGHGVGKKLHEDPYIPNYGRAKSGPRLEPGMIIAIEPILNTGRDGIVVAEDDWTLETVDGSRGAHFEHTILITDKDPEIITKI